jgi:DNA polymerase III subunit gamma/tau
MASQSLYRKWRSQTFGELVGQEPIIDTLKNALNSGKLAHAYLFTGPRGTGKTSTARLLAKTINCLNPKNGEPCNGCQQCREITAGNSFNVIEIDAASNRGIDSIRELREKVMVPPSTGKYKVYVLDEAHMLTTEAFNALLKTLEEPPSYAVFVLATTEVHKMLPTVLSRCQRFDFKRITTRQIVQHLNYIAKQEQVKLEAGAAELIARAAAGGMRDALSLLDQAIAYAGSEIALSQVQAMLGVADPRAIQQFISYVAQLNTSSGLRLIHELSEAGADLRQINAQVVEYWRSLMLAKAGADVATILDRTEDEIREIMEMTKPFALDELTECARIFAQNELIQKSQGTPQLALELAFLECVELHRRAQSGQPASLSAGASSLMHARPAASPVQPAPAAAQSARPQPVVQPAQPAQPAQSASRQVPPTPKAPEERVPALDEYEPYDYSAEPSDASPAVHQTVTEQTAASATGAGSQSVEAVGEQEAPVEQEVVQESGQAGLTVQEVKERWETVKARVKQKNKQTAPMLNYFTVVAVQAAEGETVVLIEAANETFFKMLSQSDRAKHVDWALSLEFGQPCRVRLLRPGELPAVSNPPAPPKSSGKNGAGQSAKPAPQPAPAEPATPPQKSPADGTNGHKKTPSASAAQAAPSVEGRTVPLARSNVVRENSNKVSAAEAQEMLEQKAKSNPVVQEIMRTFTVKNIQVNPK